MIEGQHKYTLKFISNIVSIITFFADLITIGLFLRSIINDDLSLTSAISQILVIIVVFIFAILLWFYSKKDTKNLNFVFPFFSWIYVLFSAAIFIMISHKFMTNGDYSFGEYIGYLLLIIFIGALGYFIYASDDRIVDYFAIPYMFVALMQIIMWIFIIFSNKELIFNWETVGNILLFIISGMLVLFLINREKGTMPLLILISCLGIIGFIVLGFTVMSVWYYRMLWIMILVLFLIGIFYMIGSKSAKVDL